MGEDIEALVGAAGVQRLRELIGDRVDAVVAVGNADGEVLWASESGSRWMFGRELDDFRGASRFDFIHPDDVAGYRMKHEQALAGATVSYTVRASTADGGWVEISAVMWRLENDAGPLVVSVSAPASHGSDA